MCHTLAHTFISYVVRPIQEIPPPVALVFSGWSYHTRYNILPRIIRASCKSVGFTWLAIFYGLLLIWVLVGRGGQIAWVARMGWLRELGRISYCLYIIHMVVNAVCQRMLSCVSSSWGDWKVVAIPILAFAASYGVAKISWIYFEEPFLRRGHVFKY